MTEVSDYQALPQFQLGKSSLELYVCMSVVCCTLKLLLLHFPVCGYTPVFTSHTASGYGCVRVSVSVFPHALAEKRSKYCLLPLVCEDGLSAFFGCFCCVLVRSDLTMSPSKVLLDAVGNFIDVSQS
jgi:hypothetical protein